MAVKCCVWKYRLISFHQQCSVTQCAKFVFRRCHSAQLTTLSRLPGRLEKKHSLLLPPLKSTPVSFPVPLAPRPESPATLTHRAECDHLFTYLCVSMKATTKYFILYLSVCCILSLMKTTEALSWKVCAPLAYTDTKPLLYSNKASCGVGPKWHQCLIYVKQHWATDKHYYKYKWLKANNKWDLLANICTILIAKLAEPKRSDCYCVFCHGNPHLGFNRPLFPELLQLDYSKLGRSPKVNFWELLSVWLLICLPTQTPTEKFPASIKSLLQLLVTVFTLSVFHFSCLLTHFCLSGRAVELTR